MTSRLTEETFCLCENHIVDHVQKVPSHAYLIKEKSINLSFNEQFPESARTWELRDKSLICLPCFIYGLVLRKENAFTFHTT